MVRIIVAHSQLNSYGGGERTTVELLHHLSARHDVTLWAGNYVQSATFRELGAYPRRDISPAGWLLASPDADAVVSQTLGSNLLALRHPRTICYLHTMRSTYLRGGARPDLVARRLLDRAAVRHAAAVLTNSEYSAEQALRHYGREVEVLPPGADAHLLTLPESAGAYMLYVGRLAPEKGVERLLEWSSELPIDLVLVGDGTPSYVSHLRSLAGPRARFRGPLVGEQLASAYAGCRFLGFLPHEEEFGLAALEAMAAGKPVIAAREGGLRTLVRDEVTGYLVGDVEEFTAAAIRLIDSDEECLRLGQAARSTARAYSWSRFADRIEALYLARA